MLEPATSTPRIGDFDISRELGRGGMSVVYQASRGATPYAIKVMAAAEGALTAEARVRVRREAAAIARLNHPNLVRVHEVGELENLPYIVMEYAEGACLDTLLDPDPLPVARAVAITRAVASALVEVHRTGLVHRDIKPRNIVVNGDHGVKLIDFGLVQTTGELDGVAGTLAYAAPEQLHVIRARIDGRSDLYALGVTLFECLTGVQPITADSEAGFLEKLATREAPDVRDLRPEVSPVLAAIVRKLLAKDPDDRYQSARGLVLDLESLPELEVTWRDRGHATLDARDPQAWLQEEMPLVGRKREGEILARAWEEARQGRGALLQLEGEGGSGKTRLVRELVRSLQSNGHPILAGKCQELDTVPFGPLREAVDDYLAKLNLLPDADRDAAIEAVREAAADHAAYIRRLSPGLARILGKAGDAAALNPDLDRQRFHDAVAGFFLELAARARGAVLVIDDIQWLDEGSLHVMQLLARRLAGSRLLLLTMARNDPQSEPKRIRFVEMLGGENALIRIELEPLSVGDAGRLISAQLGGGMLEEAAVQRLARLSRGNPFHLTEYIRGLLDQGLLRPVAGSWEVELEALSEVTLPPDVIQLVVSRIKSLHEGTRRTLAVAGLLGMRFSAGILAGALGGDREEATIALEEAVRNNLLERIDARSYAFVHDRIREAAVEMLSPGEQRDVHQAIAAELDRLDDRSPGHLYALARHYSRGHAEKNVRRVCETSLAAGTTALDHHAYEEARELLKAGLEAARETAFFDGMATGLLSGLGRACVAVGRLEEAFGYLEAALARAKDRDDRFRLQYLLTLAYAGQGRNQEALEALWRAFELAGRPYPKNPVVQLLVALACWALALFGRFIGVGFGRAKGEALKRRRILSELHYAGSMIALFEGRPVLMSQFIFRDLLNAHLMGRTGESAIAFSVYGAAMGLLLRKKSVRYYTRLGIEMAGQLGDRRALAVCRVYQAVGHRWAGEYLEASRLMREALPALTRLQPGSWYTAMMLTEVAYSTLHAGLTREALEHVRSSIPHLERTNNLMFQYNSLAVLYAQLMVTGAHGEATELWQRLEKLYEQIGHTAYAKLARYENLLAVQVERGETGPELDENIDRYLELETEDYYGTAARIFVGYGRLAQYLEAPEGEARERARRRLKRAILGLEVRTFAPVFLCNVVVWKVALARVEGQYRKAERLLRRADRLTRACGSRFGAFHVALERARLAAAVGDSAARPFAQAALEVAREEGWRASEDRVRREFGFAERSSAAGREGAAGLASSSITIDQSRATDTMGLSRERYADALLQISLASTSSWDPEEQARQALVEVARVLGAECALFFRLDEQTGEPCLTARHYVSRRGGKDAEHFSSSVVRRVLETGAPVVMTGSEGETAACGQSVMCYELRSIIAAPLKFRDRLIGVVYLHNSLAKGMFTSEHVDLLLAFANHISIAVETARAARVEAERRELQRDLELTGAVQTLLLPRESTFAGEGLTGAGMCEPATHCGGDWWWHEALADGSLMIVVGDVTGHGAPSAMVTATVAGAYQTLSRDLRTLEPARLLAELNRCIRTLGTGYFMTMSVTHLDARNGRMKVWNAGGPPVFAFRSGAKSPESVTAPGSPLGLADAPEVGCRESQLRPGDRVLICTDGVLEMTLADGRTISPRQLSKAVGELKSMPCAEALRGFRQRLAGMRDRRPPEDDLTCVLVDCFGGEGGGG